MAPEVRILPATPEHVEELARAMRKEDAAEVLASGGFSPRQALEVSLAHSTSAWTVFFGPEVAAMWGVCPGPGGSSLLGGSEIGIAWALTGTAVDRSKRSFLRVSKVALAALLHDYAALVNYVDARYTAALRWARWLGFEVCPAVQFGHGALLFHPIIYRRGH